MINDRDAALSIALFCRLNTRAKSTKPLRGSELGLLCYLGSEDTEHTAAAAAAFFMISRAAVSAMVKSLMAKNLILKEQSEIDARNYNLRLTEEGERIRQIVEEAYESRMRILRDSMGSEDFDTFIRLLDRANEIISGELMK